MSENDYALYGTKNLNLKTQEIGLLICLWETSLQIKQLIVLDFFHARRVSLLCLTAVSAQSARYSVVAVQKSVLRHVLIKPASDTI